MICAKQLTPHDLDLPRGWPCDLRRLWCNPLTFHPVFVFVSCVCSYLFVSVLLYLCSVCNLSVLRHFFCVASSSLACFFYSKELIRCQLLLQEFDCISICVCVYHYFCFWSVCICLLSDARLTVGTRAPPNNWAIVSEAPTMPVSRIEVRSNFRWKSLLRSVQVLMLNMLKVGFSFLWGRDDCDEVISGWCRAWGEATSCLQRS